MRKTIADYIAAFHRDGYLYLSPHTADKVQVALTCKFSRLTLPNNDIVLFTPAGKPMVRNYLKVEIQETNETLRAWRKILSKI